MSGPNLADHQVLC